MRLIGELRGLGLTVAEIRDLTRSCGGSFGARLPSYLDRSRERLERRIAAARQTLRRIEDFQAEHGAGPVGYDDVCPTSDSRCAASA